MTMPKRIWLKPYSVNGCGIRLRDYRLSLRRSEAARIRVTLLEDDGVTG